jgi:hypothetical protein
MEQAARMMIVKLLGAWENDSGDVVESREEANVEGLLYVLTAIDH